MYNDPQFISYSLHQISKALAALAILLATPGVPAVPVTPAEVQGMQSDIHMIFRQDMLGTGEYPDMNPLLIINPVDPRGVVIPTSTDPLPQPERTFSQTPPPFKICAEYPLGGAPSNVKCGN